MEIQQIRELFEMMDKSSVTLIEIKEGDFSVRMEKTVHAPASQTSMQGSSPAVAIMQSMPSHEPSAPSIPAGKEIKAPMVGVFHTVQIENKAVGVGTKLKKGQRVCIIEAMKLMNEIIVEEDGEILWAGLTEGELVDYGQVLFTYQQV